MYSVSLAGQYPGIQGANEITQGLLEVMSRLQSSHALLDRIMLDSCKEYSRVLALLANISWCGGVLHLGIRESVNQWLETVLMLEKLGKGWGGRQYMETVEYYIVNCCKAVRRVRSNIWAAMQSAAEINVDYKLSKKKEY